MKSPNDIVLPCSEIMMMLSLSLSLSEPGTSKLATVNVRKQGKSNKNDFKS